MPLSPRERLSAIRSNLKKKTGRTLEQWVKLVKKDGPADPKSWRGWLKSAEVKRWLKAAYEASA